MIPTTAHERFLEKLAASLTEGTFVKLTLSDPKNERHEDGEVKESELRNVYGRPVELKEGVRLQLVYRFAKKDTTKNFPYDEATEAVGRLLRAPFLRAYLFTTTGDWQWHGLGEGTLKAKKPSFKQEPALAHDKPKVKALEKAPWLVGLGVTGPDGVARPGMSDKLRQIERFSEILGHLVDEGPLREAKEIRQADLGAGKGYLTFAAHQLLQKRGAVVETTGVELRPELVDAGNKVATGGGITGLKFVAGSIANYVPTGRLDVLLALHACNTATDDALYLGIQNGAQLIVTSPCCHQELRGLIQIPAALEPMLRHGILMERYAEGLTDSIRALLLEIHGYEAKVFEFIAPEHTGKNVMIAAQRLAKPRDPEPLRQELKALLDFHGMKKQHLASRLGEV